MLHYPSRNNINGSGSKKREELDVFSNVKNWYIMKQICYKNPLYYN